MKKMKLLLVLIVSSCTITKDMSFINKVLNDFNRYSYFLVIEVKTTKNKDSYIIQNHNLFNYLQNTDKVSKEDYIKIMRDKLANKMPLTIDNPTSNFIKISDNENVKINAKKGLTLFIETYFDNRIVLKENVTEAEKIAIIQQLFEWKVPCKIDDETGYLIISK